MSLSLRLTTLLIVSGVLVGCGSSTSSQTSTSDASSDASSDAPTDSRPPGDAYGGDDVLFDTNPAPPDGQSDTGGPQDPHCANVMCGGPCSYIRLTCSYSLPYCQQGTRASATCEPTDGGVDGGGAQGVWGACNGCGI